MFRRFRGLFTKNKICQGKGNNSQSKSNLSQSNLLSQINHSASKLFSVQTASFQDTIARSKFIVNVKKFVVANIATSQITIKLEKTADKTFSCDLEKRTTIVISFTLTGIFSSYKNSGQIDPISPSRRQDYGRTSRSPIEELFIRLMRFFIKSNIHKKYYNQQKCGPYLSCIGKVYKIHFSSISSNLTVANKHTMPNTISFVKVKRTKKLVTSANVGVIKATPNHAAEKLLNKVENALNQGLVKKMLTKITVTNNSRAYSYALTPVQVKQLFNNGAVRRALKKGHDL